MRRERTAVVHKRRADGKVALLILYGVIALALVIQGVGRQVRQLVLHAHRGDPGLRLRREARGRGLLVTEVYPHIHAAQLFMVGDRVLRLGDLGPEDDPPVFPSEAVPRPGVVWRDQGRSIVPGQLVRVVWVQRGKLREGKLRFEAMGLAMRSVPIPRPLKQFTLEEFLPTQVMLWSWLVIAWLILWRRPTSRDTQLFFLLCTTAAIPLSYRFWVSRPSVYPIPLDWVYQFDYGVDALIVAFALHLMLVVPKEKVLYRRLRPVILIAIYLPAVALVTFDQMMRLWPEIHHSLTPLWRGVRDGYILAAAPVGIAVQLHSAFRASTAAGRRQVRTILLGNLPWVALGLYKQLTGPMPLSLFLAFNAAGLLGLGSIAFAILRQGLLDLGFLIRQGIIYAIVLAAAVAGYYLLVNGLGQLLLSRLGVSDRLSTMTATLTLVLLLRPVTLAARGWVDRTFYRDRLRTTRRLRDLTQEILLLLDRDVILAQLTTTLPAAFPARAAALFLCDPADGLYHQVAPAPSSLTLLPEQSHLLPRLQQAARPLTTYQLAEALQEGTLSPADQAMAEQTGAVLWLPLRLRGRLLGVLALGWKAAEEVYTREELEALTLIASEAAVALENAALSAEREKEARLQQEVLIGRAIQQRLLAPARLQVDGYEILSRSEPATEVGGDFANLFLLEPPAGERAGAGARLGIVLGDVAGKGVPAALFMAVTTTLLEAQARLLPSPGATLAAANAELYPKMRPPGGTELLFATALYGVLEARTGELRLANAGQTPPIYWPAGGAPRYVWVKGVPLGGLAGTQYEEMVLRLGPGDRLLLCSDGFIEARGAGGKLVGYSGFLEQVAALSSPTE